MRHNLHFSGPYLIVFIEESTLIHKQVIFYTTHWLVQEQLQGTSPGKHLPHKVKTWLVCWYVLIQNKVDTSIKHQIYGLFTPMVKGCIYTFDIVATPFSYGRDRGRFIIKCRFDTWGLLLCERCGYNII